MERIGVIGDVHTERVRLAGVLDHFATQKLERILCTGDLPDGPGSAGDVDACVKLLKAHNVLTIAGNHDRWLQDGEMRELPSATDKDELSQETLAFLAALPQTLELTSPGGRVLLCHGLGDDDLAGVEPHDHGLALDNNEALQRLLRAGKYRFVISGHTHRSMLRTIQGLTLINAGTLLTGQSPCCSVVDLRGGSVETYAVDEQGRVHRASS